MFIPYKTDVDVFVTPIANYFLIGLTVTLYFTTTYFLGTNNLFALRGLNANLLFYGFAHADFLHVFGNMFYLWIFGNVVCARIGNINFPPLYFLLIIISGCIHLLLDGNPVVGASGAVNGIIAVYLFFYPASNIKMLMISRWTKRLTIHIRAYLVIGFWLIGDFFGAIYVKDSIAYYAHLGGFFAGLIAAWLMHKYHWVTPLDREPNLIDIIVGKPRK